jgi:trehalose 6-phosphate phosphatase
MSPDGSRRTRVNPGFRRRIREIGDGLSQRLGRLPGIYLERKTVSVAVHHRNASPQAAARARRVVRQVMRNHSGRVRLLEGKKVLELLPPGETTKGSAVLETVAGLRRGAGQRPLLIYLGDDSTDESVFRRLGDSDLGIHVGRSQSSRATYSLHSPSAVAGFLRRVEQMAS